ncbi:M48 family metallopeptidase [Candidatus Saccharibacteria bacterium]|nr:M48 family metallopeptidase [Candidatus Saccharibacteria bacterium]
MAQKTVWLPEIGEIVLSKRSGTKNIRLSVSAAGKVRIGLPAWAPYAAGVNFAKSRTDWIKQHLPAATDNYLNHGSRIGKSYRLSYIFDPGASRTSTRLVAQSLRITSHLPLSHPSVQTAAVKAGERALRQEAGLLLPRRLAQLASKNNFEYKTVRIKKMVSRWGSCSSHKGITLNFFLMQLPWEMIDYVLLHELVHTRHLNHSSRFWSDFDQAYPGAKQTRRLLKQYRPVINSVA